METIRKGKFLKIKRTQGHFELCHRSLGLLEERVRAYFQKNYPNEEIWLVDNELSPPSQNCQHIILFGNFLRRILESGNWNLNSFKIWVLCQSAKDILVSQLGMKSENIGIIPRAEIFTAPQDIKPLDKTGPINFCYSGRLSRVKNISGLLFTYYFLEMEMDCRLSLFGRFDDEYPEDFGKREFTHSFKTEIHSLLDKIPFKNVPIQKGYFESKEWINQLPDNSMGISLSTYFMEDFNMSIHQFLENENNVIFPSWGGLQEIKNFSSVEIQHCEIPMSTEHLGIQLSKAKILAKKLSNIGIPRRKPIFPNYPGPIAINIKELDLQRKLAIKKMGPNSIQLIREQIPEFSDSKEGYSFFHQYRSHMAMETTSPDVLLISLEENFTSQKEEEMLFFSFEEISKTTSNLKVLSSDQIFYKENLQLLSKVKKIYLTFEKDRHPKFYHFLNLHSPDIEIEVITQTSKLPFHLKEIYG